VLVVNAGSSSLKLALVGEDEASEPVPSLDALPRDGVAAVGHRVVHGGPDLVAPTRIDDAVVAAIRAVEPLAPLHNAPALRALDTARRVLPEVPHVAVFDTAFHATLPPEARTYALPVRWREDWGVRRYGFHGISVAWCARRVPELLGRGAAGLRLVVCHLGSGCSVTAVHDGRSVDTTMGFSPLEGVAMATRSGSVDPGALVYLLRERGLTPDELDDGLNHRSGLLGLAGSPDLKEVEDAAAEGDDEAALALAVYERRVAAAVAALATALGGLDVVAFTAGVGEHAAGVRARVCDRLGFLGVALDHWRNHAARPDVDVATPASAVRVAVVAAREDLVIAEAVRSVLRW
jgi:acetate kinase